MENYIKDNKDVLLAERKEREEIKIFYLSEEVQKVFLKLDKALE